MEKIVNKSIKARIAFFLAVFIMSIFLVVKIMVFTEYIPSTSMTRGIEFGCFLLFITIFGMFAKEFLRKNKEDAAQGIYLKKLNDVLIAQSHNQLFYEGDVANGAKTLVKEVTSSIDTDRCSIWIYNEDKTSILCEQLYIKAEDTFYQNIELFKKDFGQYFEHLIIDPIIVAEDAEKHPATKCFTESYLKPLGIKSMLDVPIIYKGNVIGVICIENLSLRNWEKVEVDFAQMLSSLYSFAYSVKETNKLTEQLKSLVSSQTSYVLRTDMEGKHTYWNEKFENEFGWVYEGKMMHGNSLLSICESHHGAAKKAVMECIEHPGKIVNVELDKPHRDGSRRTTLWEFVCLTDSNGNPMEVQCMGIDITERVNAEKKISDTLIEVGRKETEMRNRMSAINKSNAVIEFELDGKIIYANEMFCQLTGYNMSEFIGCYHKMFIGEEYLFGNSKSKEYKEFWKKLNRGEFVSGEFERIKKDGSKIWLQASYNPIVDESGKVYKIMKIATDITSRVDQSEEIEEKNTYLEHAAKILRHDMHSGINTYIPRGISSLERRLNTEVIKTLKLEAPMKMLKEGLAHAQRVYKGVFEFTNLVKKNSVLNKEKINLRDILIEHLGNTAYISQVAIDMLPTIEVNQPLFCTAIDNLIRNGLKYNDSEFKMVAIYMEDEEIMVIQDNGRGMTQEDFNLLSKPYTRREGQKETGTGLGLNICVAILKEHGFGISCDKNDTGTKIKIKIK